jgi:hypothetical protein
MNLYHNFYFALLMFSCFCSFLIFTHAGINKPSIDSYTYFIGRIGYPILLPIILTGMYFSYLWAYDVQNDAIKNLVTERTANIILLTSLGIFLLLVFCRPKNNEES